MPHAVTATGAETTATSAVEEVVVVDTTIAMIVTLAAPAMLPQLPVAIATLPQPGNPMVAALMRDTPIESSDC